MFYIGKKSELLADELFTRLVKSKKQAESHWSICVEWKNDCLDNSFCKTIDHTRRKAKFPSHLACEYELMNRTTKVLSHPKMRPHKVHLCKLHFKLHIDLAGTKTTHMYAIWNFRDRYEATIFARVLIHVSGMLNNTRIVGMHNKIMSIIRNFNANSELNTPVRSVQKVFCDSHVNRWAQNENMMYT